MRFRCILRLVCSGYTECDSSIFGLLAESIEEIRPLVVIEHHRFVEYELTFTSPAPTSYRCEGPSVSNGTYG